MNDTLDTTEASGFLAQWARSVRPGTVMCDRDCLILARIAQALDNAVKHHQQARNAHE